MKFKVTRTSRFDGKPCAEAVKEPYTRVDARTAAAPELVSAYRDKPTDWWFGEGRNHRVERGHMKRDFDAEGWFIEIPDLSALMAFRDKYGQLIIGTAFDAPIDSIEIYDDYRE